MATSCFIGLKSKNGNIKGIKCTHDGYPEYVGVILTYKFLTKNKIEELISLGDIYSLGEHVNPRNSKAPHTMSNPQARTVVSYSRDGREDCYITDRITMREIADLNLGWVYLWEEDKEFWRTYMLDGRGGCFERSINYSNYVHLLVTNKYMTKVSKEILEKVYEKFQNS